MKTKTGKIYIIFLFILIAVFIGSVTQVSAQCPDGSGDCNISGEYQIDGKRALRMSESTGVDPAGALRDIFIGEEAGFNNPRSDYRAYGSIYLGRRAGYSLVTVGDEGNIGVNTIIGDKAGASLTSSVHNTFVGAGANQGGCNPLHSPCDIDNYPSYNTGVGSLAGYFNAGDFNNFFGTEAGEYITSGDRNIFIGVNAGAGHYATCDCPLKTGNDNIHIGFQTEALSDDLSSTIALGNYAQVTENNQMVVGSYHYFLNGSYIADIGLIRSSYWGSGVMSGDPQDFSFNATGGLTGSGANPDIQGANLIIAGGKGTGTANGGSVQLQASPPGAASSTVQNDLKDILVIDAKTNGWSYGNVTVSDESDRYSPLLTFKGAYDDCGFQYDSENEFLYSSCNFNMNNTSIFFRAMGAAAITSPSLGYLNAKANQKITLQSPTVYFTGLNNNDSNVKVGIGTSSPQSKLAVSGLPNTPPDSSGVRGLVCITNDGNMWIDDNGDSSICQ